MRIRGVILGAWLAAAGCLAVQGEARAHFLFVRVNPMAEGGRSAEVFFSEQAEAGDPTFVEKIAGTELYVQTAARPGTFEPLAVAKANDRLRAVVPAGGSLGVVGVCNYGVLARPGQTPFLLRYYPKALAGKPDELNTLKRMDAPVPSGKNPVLLEVMAAFEAGRVRFTALREGKPVPGLKFTTVDSDLSNTETTAGPDGVASWTPPKPGRYSVYVRETLKTPGEHNGKHYDEIREFATLAFTWPVDRTDSDPEAVSLFEQAVAKRAVWSDFNGFRAEVAGELDGRAYSGKVTVSADGTVKAEVDDASAKAWVEDQLASMTMHRLPEAGRDSSKEKTRPVLRFADGQEDHPLGRLLTFQGGRFASSYRVRDGEITVVNRHIGTQNMSITVLDNTPNAEGKSLPHSYLVQYWDAKTGRLNRVETFQQRWTRVGKLDLPTSHLVTAAGDSGLSVRSLTLSGHAPAK
ncbi:MAG: DUF3386 family protein [Isosphaeraceae bacterium]